MFSPPELIAAEVVSLHSIVIYELAIFHLYYITSISFSLWVILSLTRLTNSGEATYPDLHYLGIVRLFP